MPSSCCAIGCTKGYSKEKGVRLYRFPRDPTQKILWSRAIRREGLEPNEHSRICGAHFTSGETFSVILLSISGCLIMLRDEAFYRSSESYANLSILAHAWCLGHSVTCLILHNVFLTRCYYIHCVICTGKPSRSSDDPDFVPTVFEYTKRTNAGCKNDIKLKKQMISLKYPVQQMISSKYYH